MKTGRKLLGETNANREVRRLRKGNRMRGRLKMRKERMTEKREGERERKK